MWRTCLLLLWWVAGVRRGATIRVASSIVRLAIGRHGAGARVSQRPLAAYGAVEGLRRGKATFGLGEVAVGGHRVAQVCIEGRAGVYEVELCPESLLSVLGSEV